MILATVSSGIGAATDYRRKSALEAEWVETGRNAVCTVYSNPASIRRNGKLVKIWELLDLKSAIRLAKGKPHRSIKRRSEYDCRQNRWRTLYLSFYSGNMASGELVYRSSEPDHWHPVLVGSVGDTLRLSACRQH